MAKYPASILLDFQKKVSIQTTIWYLGIILKFQNLTESKSSSKKRSATRL